MRKSASSPPSSPPSRLAKTEPAPSEPAIDLPTSIPTVPRAAWPAMCDVLAKIALDSARRGDLILARRAAGDAFVMVVSLSKSESRACRSIAAGSALSLGEAFLLVEEMPRAQACFEGAARYFDGARDRENASVARNGLARALGARMVTPSRRSLES